MAAPHNAKAENIPYSLSRWTDLPAAKWDWFKDQLKRGWMDAVDQRTSVPAKWSLKPDETLGLIFWTKDPTNLIRDAALLRDYRVKIHMTVTGWTEVEKGAPTIYEGARLLGDVAKTFGPENITWRFSPVPILPDVEARFRAIAAMAESAGISKVFLAFLQDNDLMTDPRTKAQRLSLLQHFAEDGAFHKVKVMLCQDDQTLLTGQTYRNLSLGVCAPPEDFAIPGVELTPADGCGCCYVVDPFSINESCTSGCSYCYAADRSLAPKKRNTTRLRVLP